MLKRKVILATTAAAIALGTGGAVAASQSGKGNDEVREIEAVRSAAVSLPQAIATAEEQSSGRAVSAGAEDEDNRVVYEVKTIAGDKVIESEIDPETGKVVGTEDEGMLDKLVGDDADEYAGAEQLKTTLSAAIASAEQATGGTAIEAEYESEDGKALYEVEVVAADGTIEKAYVDGTSGKVIKTAAGDRDGEDRK